MSKTNAQWINFDSDNIKENGDKISIKFSDESLPEDTKAWSSAKITTIINAPGNDNLFAGINAGYNNTAGYNTFIGTDAGYSNIDGNCNVYIGFGTGHENTSGHHNVYIGYKAGDSFEVPIGNNELSINNFTSPTPLIYGDFYTHQIGIYTVDLKESFNAYGAINIGNTVNMNNGTIRYTGSDFEGYHNGQWKSLTKKDKWEVEYFTLTTNDISNKYIILAHNPINNERVALDIIHGSAQEYGIDYTVVSGTLCWDNFVLDGVFRVGNKLRVSYNY